MAVWRCGGVAVWRCGGVAVWRCGGVAVAVAVVISNQTFYRTLDCAQRVNVCLE